MNCIVLAIQIIPYSRIHYLNLLNIHFSSHTRDNIYWCLQGESQMQQATVYNVSAAWELRLLWGIISSYSIRVPLLQVAKELVFITQVKQFITLEQSHNVCISFKTMCGLLHLYRHRLLMRCACVSLLSLSWCMRCNKFSTDSHQSSERSFVNYITCIK